MKRKHLLLSACVFTLGTIVANQTVYADEEASTDDLATSVVATDESKKDERNSETSTEANTSVEDRASASKATSDEKESLAVDNKEATATDKEEKSNYYSDSGDEVDLSSSEDAKKQGDQYLVRPQEVNYKGTLVRTKHTLDTKPWGVAGYRTLKHDLRDYDRQAVTVTKEAKTTRASWLKVTFEDGLTGWVDRIAIYKAEDYLGEVEKLDGQAKVIRGRHTLDTRPYGTAGWKTLESQVNKRVGQTVKVQQVVKTTRATWAYVTFSDRTSGWIDVVALSTITKREKAPSDHYTSAVKEEALVGNITGKSHTIDSLPWGIDGFKTIVDRRDYKDYRGAEVLVTKSVSTNRASWLYINIVNKGLSGWIDKNAITITGEAFLAQPEKEDYYAKVISTNHTLDSKPWGTKGFRQIRSRAQMRPYLGQVAHVTQSAQTKRANWSFIEFKDGLNGWYDKNGLKKVADKDFPASTEKPLPKEVPLHKGDQYTSEIKEVDYSAHLLDTHHTLDSKPWGVDGFRTLRGVNQMAAYYGQAVKVTKEVSTTRANWAYITLNDGLSGWIDKQAFEDRGLRAQSWQLRNGVLYAGNRRYNVGQNFITVDIRNQRLWGVKNNKIVVDTPVITGRPGADTPRGHFKIQPYKASPTVLVGPTWRSPVKYWIPFKGNMWGIHDANWQHNGYGGNRYRIGYGSAGCVNTPLGAVSKLYRTFGVGANVVIF